MSPNPASFVGLILSHVADGVEQAGWKPITADGSVAAVSEDGELSKLSAGTPAESGHIRFVPEHSSVETNNIEVAVRDNIPRVRLTVFRPASRQPETLRGLKRGATQRLIPLTAFVSAWLDGRAFIRNNPWGNHSPASVLLNKPDMERHNIARRHQKTMAATQAHEDRHAAFATELHAFHTKHQQLQNLSARSQRLHPDSRIVFRSDLTEPEYTVAAPGVPHREAGYGPNDYGLYSWRQGSQPERIGVVTGLPETTMTVRYTIEATRTVNGGVSLLIKEDPNGVFELGAPTTSVAFAAIRSGSNGSNSHPCSCCYVDGIEAATRKQRRKRSSHQWEPAHALNVVQRVQDLTGTAVRIVDPKPEPEIIERPESEPAAPTAAEPEHNKPLKSKPANAVTQTMNSTATFAPTQQQQKAIDLAKTGKDVVVEAGAGAGKTATLAMIAEELAPKKGVFTAFNKLITEDAKTVLPSNVESRTIHSLCFAKYGKPLSHRFKGGRDGNRMKSDQIAREIGITSITAQKPNGSQKEFARGWVAAQAMKAIGRFCSSDRPEPSRKDVSLPKNVNRDPDLVEMYDKVGDVIATYLPAIWADLSRPDGKLPVEHGVYVKLAELDGIQLRGQFLMVDEAQDLSPVMVSIVKGQKHMQVIAVGDNAQQINRWMNSVSLLKHMNHAQRCQLSECQPAGTLVRVAVRGENLPDGGRESATWKDVPIEEIRAGDKVVSWNPARYKSAGNKGFSRDGEVVTDVSIRKVSEDLVVADVGGLVTRYAQNHHCVVVMGEKLDEGEHVVYMMRRNGQYRIGRSPWRCQNGIEPVRRAVKNEADGLWILSVHKSVKESSLGEALAQARYGVPSQTFVVSEDEKTLQHKMDLRQFWKALGPNGEAAERCLEDHGLLIDYPLWEQAQKGGKPRGGWGTQLVTAAVNIRSGMLMLPHGKSGPTSNGSERGFVPWSKWVPISVSREHYTGVIYSLSVNEDHTYVADGVVTHNSFRFGPEIADVANTVLEELPTNLRLTGKGGPSQVADLDAPACWLFRTNAGTISQALEELGRGRKFHITGNVKDIIWFCEGVRDLKAGRRSQHPDLATFGSFIEFEKYVKEDEGAADLKLMVKLIEDHGIEVILDALNRQATMRNADVVLSTAHKTKGMAFDTVSLGGDFPPLEESDEDDLMLLYVAVTRAKKVLDVSRVDFGMELAAAVDASNRREYSVSDTRTLFD